MNPKPHFSILATTFAGGPRPRNTALILSGLWLLLFFASLFAPPLLDDADATHAQAARAMASTGDLVTLHVDGIRYLEKAPLPYWLAAASFRLFGFNTFAAHLPQALAVLLLMLLGHRWANQAFGARTGYYTALGILTSTGVFLFTRILIPEALLSLTLAAALFAFLKSVQPLLRAEDTRQPHLSSSPPLLSFRSEAEKPAVALAHPATGVRSQDSDPPEQPAVIPYAGPAFYPYVMWASLALAVLTKGLLALVLFGAATLLYLLLVDELFTIATWKKLRPATGLLLFLAIAAPWHILAALRNPGFLRFYFWNEQVLRFLGRRLPHDFNKLPGWLFWLQHLVWLFPWTLFLPLGIAAIRRRYSHQVGVLTQIVGPAYGSVFLWIIALLVLPSALEFSQRYGHDSLGLVIIFATLAGTMELAWRRHRTGLPMSPFHRIDPQQRTILLLALFAAITLLFFSLSTNQEYYTFPAYLPLLLLLSATITRAEQTYSTSPSSQRWIAFAHAAFTALGAVIALGLAFALLASRHQPYAADLGSLLAHRGIGDYTLSMSHLFDLTTAAFAGLRLPAILAALVFATGPALAWAMRMQRRHLAATSTIAFTAAAFLFAAQLAFARFAPMLSSRDFAATIQTLERQHRIEPNTQILLFGDQSYGSSMPFYLGRSVQLVDGRSTSMQFGSTYPDAPPIFLTQPDLLAQWGQGERKILFIPAERREEATHLLAPHPTYPLAELSGKLLLTDRP